MGETKTAKLFTHGRSPADVAAVFAEIDRLLADEPFPDVRPADDPSVVPDKRSFFDA